MATQNDNYGYGNTALLMFSKLPRVCEPDFTYWFERVFGRCSPSYRYIIYNLIRESAKGNALPLSYKWYRKIRHQNDPRSLTIAAAYIAALTRARVYPYSQSLELCTSLQIPQPRAERLLRKIQSFHVQGYHTLSTAEDTTQAIWQRRIAKARRAVSDLQSRRAPSDVRWMLDILNNLNLRDLPFDVQELERSIEIDRRPNPKLSRAADLLEFLITVEHGCLYEPAPPGYRFYASHGLTTMRRQDRWMLTPPARGFAEVDLTHAHPAIASTLIGNPPALSGLLQRDYYGELIQASGANKSRVKRTMTMLLYGARNQSLMLSLSTDLDIHPIEHHCQWITTEGKRAFTALLQHPAVQELRAGLQNLYAQIKSRGYLTDAFGTKVRLLEGDKPATVLSYVCTSYEKKLLEPLYTMHEQGRLRLVCDQHDGCTYYEPTDPEGTFRAVRDAVQEVAQELGILTRLEKKN